jgi:Ulp1 family protease
MVLFETCDLLFIPINTANAHWTLVVVDLKAKQLQYYDSFHHENSLTPNAIRHLANVRQYLLDDYLRWLSSRTELPAPARLLDLREWHDVIGQDMDPPSPQQPTSNYYDCGFFMLRTIEYRAIGKILDFTVSDMKYFRLRTILEILDGQLLQDDLA